MTALAFQHDFGPQNGLDALAARGLVELDGAKKVVEVGNGQRGLAIGRGTGHHFIDPVGSVHDGEFGVQAQMDKHGCIVESPRPPLGRHHHAGRWPSLQSFRC